MKNYIFKVLQIMFFSFLAILLGCFIIAFVDWNLKPIMFWTWKWENNWLRLYFLAWIGASMFSASFINKD